MVTKCFLARQACRIMISDLKKKIGWFVTQLLYCLMYSYRPPFFYLCFLLLKVRISNRIVQENKLFEEDGVPFIESPILYKK